METTKYSLKKDSSKKIYAHQNEDPQGLPWGHQRYTGTRYEVKKERIVDYHRYDYQNEINNEPRISDCELFQYSMNHNIPVSYSHSQLRDNIQYTNSGDLYALLSFDKLLKYNPKTYEGEIVLTFNDVITSFHIISEYMILGTMNGDLILTDIKGRRISLISFGSIINCCKFFMDSGNQTIIAGSNTYQVVLIDTENFKEKLNTRLESPVNYAIASHDRKKIAACLDNKVNCIVDSLTGQKTHSLVGHERFAFTADWDPSNEYYLATGSEDLTARIWDIRQGSTLTPVETLRSSLSVPYKVKYSDNGKYFAFLESSEYFNLFDKKNMNQRQVFDYFGDYTGFAFCEEDDKNLLIYLGVKERDREGDLIELKEKSSENIFI